MIMSSTNFGALEAATFTGDVIGNVTGNVTGNLTGGVTGTVTGSLIGLQTLPAVTAYTGADAGTLAIDPGIGYASMTKADGAGAYTLAAPGAGNVGKFLVIVNGHATAHVITVQGLAGGNTLTFDNEVGAGVLLLAVSATVWAALGLGGAVQSQVG
jgi:hypothetical protein